MPLENGCGVGKQPEEVTELAVISEEAAADVLLLEAAHRLDPALGAGVVLLEPPIKVGAGAGGGPSCPTRCGCVLGQEPCRPSTPGPVESLSSP